MLFNLQKIKTEQGTSTNTAHAISRKKREILFSLKMQDLTLHLLLLIKLLLNYMKLKYLLENPIPCLLQKNWYSKPIPPDMQFEERIFQTQFSISTDKLYEWNIDGLSKQEIIYKMGHMSMVANAYFTNHNVDHVEIVDLLTTGFSRTLRGWWENFLAEESRESIRKAVKKDDEGLPIFDENIGRGILNGVNTLIYTIIKHFFGTPSNIASHISDYLNNLRCPTLFNYRWYQDVFISRVMLRKDCLKAY